MKKTLLVTTFVSFVFLLNACSKKEKVGFEVISKSESDSISQGLDSTAKPQFARGTEWKLWKEYFIEFVTNDSWRPSDATYLGLSNNKGAGTIFDTRTNGFVNKLSDFDAKSAIALIDTNPYIAGKSKRISGVDLNALLGTSVNTLGDASLQAALQSADTSVITVNKYRVEDVSQGKLSDTLNMNPKFAKYKERALASKNRVILRSLRIEGYTATANLSSNLSAGLIAKLDSGKVDQNLGDANVTLHFARKGSKQIIVTSNVSSYIFVELVKGKKIIEQ